MTTPLRRRVPRPPAIFVGREPELAWLDAAFDRGTVALVGGWAGIGKTALVASFCQRLATEQVVCVSAESLRSLYEQLCSHWCEAAEPTDEEGCAFAIIAGVERRREHLLIEDAHRFSDSEELMTLVAKFAKWSRGASRLIVLGRTRLIVPEVAEQSLWLDPLSDGEIAELLTRCAARKAVDDLHALVRRARGSPLEARRLASGGSPDLPAQLSDLSADSLALVSLLSCVDRLPAFALPGWLEPPAQRLVSLQLVEREAAVFYLADANRALLGERPLPSPELAGAIATALVDVDLNAWRWQALILGRLAARDDLVNRCLAEVDEGFVGMVGAQRLFAAIADSKSNGATRARLLCIVSAPWPKGLAWLAELPTPTDATLKLAYAHALFAANQGQQANRVFREVAFSDGVADCRLGALIGLARGTGEQAVGEISEHLAALELPLESDRLERDVWLSLARHRAGQRLDAQTLARSVFAQRHRLSKSRAATCRDLYYVLVHLAMFAEARILAEEESYAHPHSPRWVYYAAVLAVETCDDQQRRSSLERLEQVASGSMRYRFLVAYLNERHAQQVELARALNEAREMWSVAQAVEDPLFLADCRLYELELAVYAATTPPASALADDGVHAELVALVELRMTGRDSGAAARVGDGPWHTILEAERLWAAGRAREADTMLDVWIADARRRGAVLEEADLRVAQAHILMRWAGSEVARAHIVRDQLLELATAHGLDEIRRLAMGMKLLLGTARPADSMLLALSEGRGLTARVARSLLGEQQLDWSSDKDTLRCALRRWESADRRALELDTELCVVKAPGGHALSLGNHRLLYRVVEVLASCSPRGATKERLALEVWSVTSYRPSRDDKRIQVAVARLRSLISKVGFPVRVATTPTGYALAQESELDA
jgi:hypothetical protein